MSDARTETDFGIASSSKVPLPGEDAQDVETGADLSLPCPLPGCATGATSSGSVGSNSKLPISNAMMKAYVAMRADADGVVVGSTDTLLGELFRQETVRDPGAPQ